MAVLTFCHPAEKLKLFAQNIIRISDGVVLRFHLQLPCLTCRYNNNIVSLYALMQSNNFLLADNNCSSFEFVHIDNSATPLETSRSHQRLTQLLYTYVHVALKRRL